VTDLEIALDIIRRLKEIADDYSNQQEWGRAPAEWNQAREDAEELLARYPQLNVEIPKDN
jgi:hypothetical protein